MLRELRELPELRADAAGLAEALARARYLRACGLPQPAGFRALVKEHRLACSEDGLAQAEEALHDAEGPARKARLATLRDFLRQARALELETGAAQELFDLPQRPLVRLPGDAGLHGALPAVHVARGLPVTRSRDRRAEMEAALAAAMQPADGVRSAAWEAAQEAGAAREDTAFCDQLLAATDAIADDLGAWLLERHTGAQKGEAERHDLLHLLHAPHFASAFPRGELDRTVRRWGEMLRFDISAGGSLKLDADDRPLKWPGAHAEPIDPPFEAGVAYLPEEGPRALAALLGAIGRAQLRLGPPENAPPEDLWLGDPAVAAACDFVLRDLLLEPEFVRRCAKADLPRDDQRALAMAAAFDARIDAARALAEAQAHESGLGAKAAQAHRDFFMRATGANLPPGLALGDLEPWGAALARLRGRMLAARMREFLRERYDEDWWRNPRSAASLDGLWSRGGRPTFAELWAELGGSPSVDALLKKLTDASR